MELSDSMIKRLMLWGDILLTMTDIKMRAEDRKLRFELEGELTKRLHDRYKNKKYVSNS